MGNRTDIETESVVMKFRDHVKLIIAIIHTLGERKVPITTSNMIYSFVFFILKYNCTINTRKGDLFNTTYQSPFSFIMLLNFFHICYRCFFYLKALFISIHKLRISTYYFLIRYYFYTFVILENMII